jgi:proline iminopeptidase
MTVSEGMIDVTGGKVWYQLHDEGIVNTPVLILHGGPGSSCYSMQGLKELAKERPVIFYDQLGCGRSERPQNPSLWHIDRFVGELAQVREALSLDEVHILGHSWGTTLAAAYLLTKPVSVKSVIFSSPCLSAPIWAEDQKQNRELLPKDVQQTLLECEQAGRTDSEEYKQATIEFYKRFVCRLDPYPEFLQKGAAYRNPELYKIMWGPSEFHVTGNLKSFDCTSRLGEIHIPALYTCGRYDEATPSSTEYFHSLTKNSQFHVFEESAHMPYVEEPEAYIKVVQTFFRNVDLGK